MGPCGSRAGWAPYWARTRISRGTLTTSQGVNVRLVARPPRAASPCTPATYADARRERRSRGLKHDKGENGGGRSEGGGAVRQRCVEPCAVARGHVDAMVANFEGNGAGVDGDQLDRSRAVRLAVAPITRRERPRPQLDRAVTDEQSRGAARGRGPQGHRVL